MRGDSGIQGVDDLLAGPVVDLGRPLFVGMPQSPNHPAFRMTLERRHGDMFREDGSSAANDLLTMGTHVGTHIDALSHVSHGGKLFGGVDAAVAQTGGRFQQLGVETIGPVVRRGVLLDIPVALGVDTCDAGFEILPEHLELAAEEQDVDIPAGCVVLIRTGWGRYFDEPRRYLGHETGVPGPGEPAAVWLSERRPYAVGSDTVAFERIPSGSGHRLLPVHRHLLVESGIYIIEALDLESMSEFRDRSFVFVCLPLKLVGGTGSPVRPVAIIR